MTNTFFYFFSPRHIANKFNEKFDDYNAIAVSILSPLSDKYTSFSIWNVPSYLVQIEKTHSKDGLHYQWPITIGKILMVHFKYNLIMHVSLYPFISGFVQKENDVIYAWSPYLGNHDKSPDIN